MLFKPFSLQYFVTASRTDQAPILASFPLIKSLFTFQQCVRADMLAKEREPSMLISSGMRCWQLERGHGEHIYLYLRNSANATNQNFLFFQELVYQHSTVFASDLETQNSPNSPFLKALVQATPGPLAQFGRKVRQFPPGLAFHVISVSSPHCFQSF